MFELSFHKSSMSNEDVTGLIGSSINIYRHHFCSQPYPFAAATYNSLTASFYDFLQCTRLWYISSNILLHNYTLIRIKLCNILLLNLPIDNAANVVLYCQDLTKSCYWVQACQTTQCFQQNGQKLKLYTPYTINILYSGKRIVRENKIVLIHNYTLILIKLCNIMLLNLPIDNKSNVVPYF